ncbi:GH116 family glycosyl-hydrolase [Fodinicola acaciae]|uniref:GH116 family glycosyl-hydrolase n=1 Tax=Fodinicola acaciae TaxID=2681555 RepID=UPI0013D09F94|nr:GH116 family glycosyl-hydrolase [Fodinicola acaciae]
MQPDEPCCDDPATCCPPGGAVSRRVFLTGAFSALTLLSSRAEVAAAFGVDPAQVRRIGGAAPYDQATITALADRGQPVHWSGAALAHIGMPVGGITTGQLYLGGDGRLWWWDIDNQATMPAPGVGDGGGPHYVAPISYLVPSTYAARFRQGFAIRTVSAGQTITKALDSTGFDPAGITFTGRYPIGRVDYPAAGLPVSVSLEAFSPFIPTNADDSSLPATVLAYTVKNTSTQQVTATLAGWSEAPVALTGRLEQPLQLHSRPFNVTGGAGVEFSATAATNDILFEDFDTYGWVGWTATGNAFGAGPVPTSSIPVYMQRYGDLETGGPHLVTSHNFRAANGDIGVADSYTGTLTSRPFTISRDYVRVRVGGGNWPGEECVNVVVDGSVVGGVTGNGTEPLTEKYVNVSAYRGKSAMIQIVDARQGEWAHVNVGHIEFTDSAPDIVFDDFEAATYNGWTVTGNAFGSGPIAAASVPDYMKRFGDLHVSGANFVTSHNFRLGGDPDSYTGTMTKSFTVSRNYVRARVGGGNWTGETCVNVVVNGTVVGSLTGDRTEPLTEQYVDVSAYKGQTATIQIVDSRQGEWAHINVDYIVFTDTRADIVVDDFEAASYAGWTVTGNAFGSGPIAVSSVPDYLKRFGDLYVHGANFVTSHNFRLGGDPDSYTGTMSRTFAVSRRYLSLRVGGGNKPGTACVNVLVNGTVIGTFTGDDTEPLKQRALNLSAYQGQTATIQIVDNAAGAWSHISVDNIVLTDRPPTRQLDRVADQGTFAIAALAANADAHPSLSRWSTVNDIFDAPDAPSDVDGGVQKTLAGAVRVPVTLDPGASATVRFAVSWRFPVPRRERFSRFADADTLTHHYAGRFASAQAVAGYLGTDLSRLENATRSWVDAVYESSTLPYWFLQRVMAPAATAATTTCYWFGSGRFYGFEGLYCCDGTCEHVWTYAQSIARLFPALERDTRERVDLGVGFHSDTGAMGFRAEYDMNPAADGDCGTVLRIYREHQMSPDSSFLQRNWPKIKTAVNYLIGQDGNNNGIFEGRQWTTLDDEWWGVVPWISGLYVAALRAASAMAGEMGDTAFANQCATLATAGTNYLNNNMWNAQYGYYINKPDPNHPSHNSNSGSYIDQMFGQMYAGQLDLPRVFPADRAKIALANLYRYNLVADPVGYRSTSPAGTGARTYADRNEPGMVMSVWPFGVSSDAGSGWIGYYFNEVWTGMEYQAAAHMMAEGLVDQSLAVVNAVNNRYDAAKRNPYNEIECSDHYARAMSSHAVFLAASGYSYHGPAGKLGFAPKISPESFQSAFTAATGWGSYQQLRDASSQTCRIDVRYGQVRLSRLSFETTTPPTSVTVTLAGQPVAVGQTTTSGARVDITLGSAITVAAGQRLEVVLR